MARNDNKDFELIRQKMFGSDSDKIVLTDDQKEQMVRWNFAMELRLCDNYYSKAIVKKLMEKFGISRATAYNDIGYAETLWGYRYPINKRVRIGGRIDFLEEQIRKMYQLRQYTVAAMLEKELRGYYSEYPDIKEVTPRTLIFSYDGNEPLKKDLPTVEDAEFLLIEAAKKNG